MTASLYRLDLWQRRRWETDSRWYVAELVQDLWGNWRVRQSWGSRFSDQGNGRSLEVSSYAEGLELMERTGKRRMQRGYRETQ